MLKSFWRVAIVTTGLLAASVSPAVADGGPSPGASVNPCAVDDICVGVTDPPGTPTPKPSGTGSGGDGGTQICSWNGHQWPCWDNDLGWFDNSTGCYYKQENPQPPAGDSSWAGHDPHTGAVYLKVCRDTAGGLGGTAEVFLAQAPGGPPPDDPQALGDSAFKMIHFDRPQLHAAPADSALVGMPVWLWYTATPTTSGQQSATAKGNVLSVTATATLADVSWDTGDGGTEDCKGPGTPYQPGGDPGAKPSCSHVYHASSALQPHTEYFLTATLTWHVVAQRDDTHTKVAEFDYPVTTDQPLPLKVGEVQVLN